MKTKLVKMTKAEAAAHRRKNRCPIKSSPPKFCWICSKPLSRTFNKSKFVFYRVIRDQDDISHHIHDGCVDQAIDDGHTYDPLE